MATGAAFLETAFDLEGAIAACVCRLLSVVGCLSTAGAELTGEILADPSRPSAEFLGRVGTFLHAKPAIAGLVEPAGCGNRDKGGCGRGSQSAAVSCFYFVVFFFFTPHHLVLSISPLVVSDAAITEQPAPRRAAADCSCCCLLSLAHTTKGRAWAAETPRARTLACLPVARVCRRVDGAFASRPRSALVPSGGLLPRAVHLTFGCMQNHACPGACHGWQSGRSGQ